MTTLGEVAGRLEVSIRPPNDSPADFEGLAITDVTHDSRSAGPGSLFCCVIGDSFDGHDFAALAVESGAVAILCERPVGAGVPELLVSRARPAMAQAASLVHGDPSKDLTIVGVTGTNGKTTVVSLVADILNGAGYKTDKIGTLTGERTTPESTDLQRRMGELVAAGVTHLAMEVSSHALVQHRVDSVSFDVAVFTNLGSDHLDFHKTPEAYFAAKAKLFDPDRSRLGVVSIDDVHGRLLQDSSGGRFVGVSLSQAANLSMSSEGSTYLWRGERVTLPLIGRHNVVNALLASEACVSLGVAPPRIAEALSSSEPVPGRFEIYRSATNDGGTAAIVVDFAHTPDALENVLSSARAITGPSGHLTVVFGCGGDRDKTKRPMMGRIAVELSDRVLVTSDNPRSEDPSSIVEEIVVGARSESSYESLVGGESRADLQVVEDRMSAIRLALADLHDGDVVVVAGKGHETGQIFADRIEPFDDRQVVRSLIAGGTAS